MRIALIACTKSKKAYKCAAHELYSESPRFKAAYTYSKLVADDVFILSAKYGLVHEDEIIEPYDETLLNKSIEERQEWAMKVLERLSKVSDLNSDEFTIIAGRNYYEELIPHLTHYWLPLKGKKLTQWLSELNELIEIEHETDYSLVLHHLFNKLPRLDWTMINSLPYKNGIYIMFENGEMYYGMDRIVRVGTHRGQNRLLERLRNHFVIEDADGSIFRKNIGRALLNMNSDPYLHVWDIDMHDPVNKNNYGHLLNEELENELERKISQYLRNNISFVCLPVETEAERLRLEEGIIATLNNDKRFKPSSKWLGLYSPITDISKSGLWNRHGLQGEPLSSQELERIKWLVRFGTDNEKIKSNKTYVKREPINVEKTISKKTALDVRKYIDELIQDAKTKGKEFLDLVSGDIHRKLNMKNRMPLVCKIMYEKMLPRDEVLHTTPSGMSSTIKIRYNLRDR